MSDLTEGPHVALILRRLELDDTAPPGMYLTLHHGRNAPDEHLDDWGFDGPVFGPLDYCHITYMCGINLGATLPNGVEVSTGPMHHGDVIGVYSDMLTHDGKFYGDWELRMHRPARTPHQ